MLFCIVISNFGLDKERALWSIFVWVRRCIVQRTYIHVQSLRFVFVRVCIVASPCFIMADKFFASYIINSYRGEVDAWCLSERSIWAHVTGLAMWWYYTSVNRWGGDARLGLQSRDLCYLKVRLFRLGELTLSLSLSLSSLCETLGLFFS